MDKLFTDDTLYWCPMHHEIVTSDKDSRCPECNMFVEEIPQDELENLRHSNPYGCVMDPVVRPESEKEEDCPICGMSLVPIDENANDNKQI